MTIDSLQFLYSVFSQFDVVCSRVDLAIVGEFSTSCEYFLVVEYLFLHCASGTSLTFIFEAVVPILYIYIFYVIMYQGIMIQCKVQGPRQGLLHASAVYLCIITP